MRIFVVPLPKCIAGIALWPFILVRRKNPPSQLIRHEQIHLHQQIELGIFLFYIWYSTEFSFVFFGLAPLPKRIVPFVLNKKPMRIRPMNRILIRGKGGLF